MADGRPVDARASFAGQRAPAAPPGARGAAAALPTSLLGPRPVQLSAGVVAAAWWSPRHLAVASSCGSVAVALLPGALNVLGDCPLGFAPAARVAALPAAAGGAAGPGAAGSGIGGGSRGMLVVEPLLGPAAAGGGGRSGAMSALEAALAAAAAPPATPQPGSRNGGAAAAPRPPGAAGWLASKLGVGEEAAAAARPPGSAGPRPAAFSNGAAEPPPRGWRLHLVAERTPAQMVQVHLRRRDWGSALQLCKAAGLHPDVVYRARWAAAPVSKANIQVGALAAGRRARRMHVLSWWCAECRGREGVH